MGDMNPPSSLRAILLGLGFAVASGFAAGSKAGDSAPKADKAGKQDVASEAAAKSNPEKKSSPDSAAPKRKRALEKGMTEETIIEIIGKPMEVRPMEAPDGKAEMWIYRQETGQRSVQVVVGEREIPAYTGVGNANEGMRTTKELIYGTKHVKTYRVTSLLMFNGQLTVARQTQEQSETY
jgi:hypothetical protein